MSILEAIDKASSAFISPSNSGQRRLEPNKILSMIPASDPFRDYVKQLLLDTRYITWDETITNLEASLDDFLSTVQSKFYLSLNKYKFSSELVFVCVFWDKLKDHVIDLVEIGPDLPPDCTVLSIDDFILTAQSLAGPIDVFQYETYRNDVHFYVCVAGSTPDGLQTMEGFGAKVFYGLELTITTIPHEFQKQLSFGDNNETINMYTDHKISNVMLNTPYLFQYGLTQNYHAGCLITYPPDEGIKMWLWKQFFSHVMAPPTMFNYQI